MSGFWSITVSLMAMCESLWQFLRPRLITWYFEKFPCKKLLLYHSEMFLPSSVKISFRFVSCLCHWKQLVVIRVHSFHQWRGIDSWGHPLVVAYQSLVVSWLILTLFFLFVKYYRTMAIELLEKPYALSLLMSREVSHLWFFRYAVKLFLNIGSINDVSSFLSNCSKTFPITVSTVTSL